MERGAWRVPVHGVARVGHALMTKPRAPPDNSAKALSATSVFQMSFHWVGLPWGLSGKEYACNVGDS